MKGKNHPLYKRKEVLCTNCSKVLLRTPYQLERRDNQFCDRKCDTEYKKRIGFYNTENHPSYKGGRVKVKCTNCEKEKEVKQYQVSQNYFYCSKKCMKEHKSTFTQDKAYNWKGGINKLQNSIRKLTDSKDWTKSIFERDYYTCQRCMKGNNQLEAHHLIGVSQLIKMNKIKTVNEAKQCNMLWDLNNGVTMCKKCHREFHNLFGVYKFTPQDYYKFIGGEL